MIPCNPLLSNRSSELIKKCIVVLSKAFIYKLNSKLARLRIFDGNHMLVSKIKPKVLISTQMSIFKTVFKGLDNFLLLTKIHHYQALEVLVIKTKTMWKSTVRST